MAEVNRLLKQHRQMADAFKMMSKGGGKGFARMAQMLGGMGGGGGGMDRLKSHGRRQDADARRQRSRRWPPSSQRRRRLRNFPAWAALPPGFNPFKK